MELDVLRTGPLAPDVDPQQHKYRTATSLLLPSVSPKLFRSALRRTFSTMASAAPKHKVVVTRNIGPDALGMLRGCKEIDVSPYS